MTVTKIEPNQQQPNGKSKHMSTNTTQKLANQVALVTGASGDLGRVMAVVLAKSGADVAVHYFHNREKAEEVGAEIAKLGRKYCLITGNVSDAAASAVTTANMSSSAAG